MIESLNADLDCHRGVARQDARSGGWPRSRPPASWPSRSPPGSSSASASPRDDRIDALEAIAAVAPPPRPRAGGDRPELPAQGGHGDARRPPCPTDDYLDAIALARLILPADVHLQAPPNLSDDFGVLLDAGIDDWGGVSPVTADHVNPERPWPALDRLREVTEARGFALAPRLTIYPEFALDPERWLDDVAAVPRCSTAPTPRASAATTRARCSRSGSRRPAASRSTTASRSCTSVAAARPGTRARRSTRPRCVPASAAAAGRRRWPRCSPACCSARRSARTRSSRCSRPAAPRWPPSPRWPTSCAARSVGDVVTYVRNRNINYTNVCTFKCRFCGFSKGPLSLNLRGTPYLLTLDDIAGPGASRPSTSAPPRSACRAASTPTSTATTTSTSPGR